MSKKKKENNNKFFKLSLVKHKFDRDGCSKNGNDDNRKQQTDHGPSLYLLKIYLAVHLPLHLHVLRVHFPHLMLVREFRNLLICVY